MSDPAKACQTDLGPIGPSNAWKGSSAQLARVTPWWLGMTALRSDWRADTLRLHRHGRARREVDYLDL